VADNRDMNKTFYMKKENVEQNWRLIDAEGQILGRLATGIANALRGKDKPTYTPHTDCGDYIVVINADKIVLTGNKMEDKIYDRVSGFIGGYKTATAKEMMIKHPTDIIELAVKRMLPKNYLSRQVIRKLKIYVGSEHPHKAQLG
jgi:large subunit ribosomal protein L13